MPDTIRTFGDFQFDASARELRRQGTPLPISAKAFDLLAYLIEHSERAVGRDELISAVWGRVDVTDDLLAQTLGRARRAVGDSGAEQHSIKTIPRFGYRWIRAEGISTVVEAGQAEPGVEHDFPRVLAIASDAPAADARQPARGRRTRWIGLAALAAVAIAALLFAIRRPIEVLDSAAQRMTVVLPVAVTPVARETAWIRLGAMEYVASVLREDASDNVMPSEQVLALFGADVTAAALDSDRLRSKEPGIDAMTVVACRATLVGTAWNFSIDVRHAGHVQTFSGDANDPLEAARIAVAGYLRRLGIAAPNGSSLSPLTELVHRVDAAVLAGNMEDARALLDAAPASLRSEPDVQLRAAQVAFHSGQLAQAQTLYTGLMEHESDLSATMRGRLHMGLGSVAMRRGDFQTATARFSEAIDSLRRELIPDRRLIGVALMDRAAAQAPLDLADAALSDFGRARIEFESVDDVIGIADVDTNFGLLNLLQGHFSEALEAFDHAAATYARFGAQDSLATVYVGKASAQLATLNYAAADATAATAWKLVPLLNSPILVERVASVRARALIGLGKLSEAATLLDHVSPSEERASASEINLLRAKIALERGDTKEATARASGLIEQAASTHPPMGGFPLSEAVLLVTEAARRSSQSSALGPLRTSLDAVDPKFDRDLPLAREVLDAEIDSSQRNPAAADHFDRALALAETARGAATLTDVSVAYLGYLLACGCGEPERTASIAGRLAAIAQNDYRANRAMQAFYESIGDTRSAARALDQARRLAGARDVSLPW
ncbi:MAG: winged helix-turn-helix domain-containing protein [Dokdonella sp.]